MRPTESADWAAGCREAADQSCPAHRRTLPRALRPMRGEPGWCGAACCLREEVCARELPGKRAPALDRDWYRKSLGCVRPKRHHGEVNIASTTDVFDR